MQYAIGAALHRQLDFSRGRAGVSRRSEVGTVIGKHGMHLIRNGFEQGPEKIARYPPGGLFMQLDVGKFGGAVDGNEKIKPALLGTNLGDVDVEITDRIGFELFPTGRSPSTSGRREMPWRRRQRCSEERVRCGIVA